MGIDIDKECKPGSPLVLAGRSRDHKASAVFLFLFAILFFAIQASLHSDAQTSGKTVRHHRVEEGDPYSAKLTEAENDLAKRDYAAAEPILRQIVAQHPHNYVAWYDLGYLCHALGRREESIAAYRKSLDAKPDVFESNLNLGLAFAEAGQPEAEQYLRAATKLEPKSEPAQGRKRAWMALGAYLQSRNPEQALEAFRQGALADPEDPEPHLLAGSLLEKQHPAEAEKEYQQGIAIDPNSSDANTALANLYMRQRRFSEAEPLLRKLLATHPNDASVHFQLGRMLAIAGKNNDAVAELEAGLKLDPSDSKAQRDLADLYLDSGKYDEAQKLYRTLLSSYPQDADLHYGFGRALLKHKQFAEAQQELMKTLQLKPDLGAAYGDLAVAANENKNYPLAIQAVDARAKYLPDTPMSFFLRATAYDHLHDAQKAAAYYHQFLDVAGGKYPDQEWQAQHRLIAIEPKK
jgi:tetratricopeptide (TPR) repeat protein